MDQLRSVSAKVGREAKALEKVATAETLGLAAASTGLVFPGARDSAEAVVSKFSGCLG